MSGETYWADLHMTFVEWPLRGDEYTIASKKFPKVGLDTLMRAQDPEFGKPKDDDDKPRTDSVAEQFSNLRINNFELNLSTSHKSPITLTLGQYGTLDLAPHALKDLNIHGDLQKANYPNKQMEDNPVWNSMMLSKTNRKGSIAMDLGSLNIASMDVRIPAFEGFAGGNAKGGLSISKIQDLRLDFAGLVPGHLAGRVGNLSLTDIEIDLDQLKGAETTGAPPVVEYDDLSTFVKEEETP
jgi:hypothetical protein